MIKIIDALLMIKIIIYNQNLKKKDKRKENPSKVNKYR
jgi:hypothetical protein